LAIALTLKRTCGGYRQLLDQTFLKVCFGDYRQPTFEALSGCEIIFAKNILIFPYSPPSDMLLGIKIFRNLFCMQKYLC
jgi:hypothetical protein